MGRKTKKAYTKDLLGYVWRSSPSTEHDYEKEWFCRTNRCKQGKRRTLNNLTIGAVLQLLSLSHPNCSRDLKSSWISSPIPVHIVSLVATFYTQAILASHFSKSSMSGLPSSPLLPLALHSANSTFMESWEKSNSLPFFPSWEVDPECELSNALGAAERVTRKVFLLKKKDLIETNISISLCKTKGWYGCNQHYL